MALKAPDKKPDTLRPRAIQDYHELLAADARLSPAVFQKLYEAMRNNRLVYGDRPIGVSLRPHLLEAQQFNALAETAELVVSALEKIAAAALQEPSLMQELGLTDAERRLALIDPGYSSTAITTRLDGFVHGDEIKFVEYNAENPSSLSDQEGLNGVLSELSIMSTFSQRYQLRQFSPVDKLLQTLLATYQEWGGSDVPNIAILDWKNLPTSNEFVLLQNHFGAHGVRTIICSPDDLSYEQGRLRCGGFEIDLVYKRILIHEFLSRYDDSHPLIRAYVNRDVCLINPFRCKLLHKKASFELLTDEKNHSWFTSDELAAIRRSIPWTRRLRDRSTIFKGETIQLLEFVQANRWRLVLKPNDDYGGRGVYIGARMDQSAWEDAIGFGLTTEYVVQEAVDLHTEEFPVFTDNEWELQPLFVDTNPFLFRGEVCGAMVRLSTSPIVNVSSGGGEAGFFVIDGVKSRAQEMASE